MRWSNWKEQVRASPRRFLDVFATLAVFGLIVTIIGGLMSSGTTGSSYGSEVVNTPATFGFIVFCAGLAVVVCSMLLMLLAGRYWLAERRRQRDEAMHS